MKQIVPFLLLFAFAATMLYSCKDVVMPDTPPQTPVFEIVEVNLSKGDELTAGESFNVTVKLQEINENISVEGVEVNLTGGSFVDDNDDSKDITAAETDSDGIATFNNLRITDANTYELRITSRNSKVSNEVVPELTVKPDEPNLAETIVLIDNVNISDKHVDIQIGSTKEIQVQVRDRFRNLRSDSEDPLTLQITSPNGSTTISKNGENGGIEFNSGVFVIGKEFKNAGENSIYVSFDESLTVNFDDHGLKGTVNVIEPQPNSISIEQQPLSEVTAGQNISDSDQPIQVKVLDMSDEPMEGVGVEVTLLDGGGRNSNMDFDVQPNPNPTTNEDGVAAFEELIINTAGTYKLKFAAVGMFNGKEIKGIEVVTDEAFVVKTADVSSIELVSNQPEDIEVENAVNPSPRIKVEDEFDNPVPDITVSYSVYMLNEDDETFTEVESKSGNEPTDANGTATFDNIIIDDPGNYKLRFEVDGFVNINLETESFEVQD